MIWSVASACTEHNSDKWNIFVYASTETELQKSAAQDLQM